MKKRKLLFSLTKKDFTIQTFRAGGAGGQNQNKVESGVRIIHPASGARGEARDSRKQLTNKKTAFRRLIDSKKFQDWHKIECARRLGTIEAKVNEQMQDHNLKIEYL